MHNTACQLSKSQIYNGKSSLKPHPLLHQQSGPVLRSSTKSAKSNEIDVEVVGIDVEGRVRLTANTLESVNMVTIAVLYMAACYLVGLLIEQIYL